jgi:hypothetical protein
VESWSKEVVVGQSLACEIVNMKAEAIVAILHQAKTGEDAAD